MIAHVSTLKQIENDSPVSFTEILPAILKALQFEFRKLDEERREDAIHEAVANCYVAYRRLIDQGRGSHVFPSVLARFAASQVRDGRLVGSPMNAKDVSSRYAQRRRGFVLQSLDQYDDRRQEWREAVINDTKTPVFQQVSFRIDFPAWLKRLTNRDRQIALALAKGYTTSWVATKFKLSRARVSQLRHELRESWREFHAGSAKSTSLAVA